MISLQSIPKTDQVNDPNLLNSQKIDMQIQQDSDGVRLTLDGNGQSLIFNSNDFLKDISIQQTIKSISIINAPNSTIGKVLNTPILCQDSPYSIIANNTIANVTRSSYTYGIMLDNSPHSEIYNNTIFNVTSTSDSASGIHLVNSQNTTIRNNTIDKIASNAIGYFESKDSCGILIDSSNEVEIFDTIIENLDDGYGYGCGILVTSSLNIEINDSFINVIRSSSSQGIYAADSGTSVTKNNTITNITSFSQASTGISLQNSPDSLLIHNNITAISGTDQVSGVALDNSNNSIVGNNSIQTLSTSSHLRFLVGIGLKSSEAIRIEWNILANLDSSDSEAIGIFTEKSKNLEVNNNTIINVTSSFGFYFIKIDGASISWNNLTNVQNLIYIDETSKNVLYSHNIVDGQNVTLQTFTRPTDLVFLEGDTSYIISWIASDPNADNYTIYKDDVLIDNGTWTDGSPINHLLNYQLPVGVNHTYHIVLTENTGYNITDYVCVRVIEIDLPQLVNAPSDLYIGLETTNQILSWNLTDSHPGNYTIYQNGSIFWFDSWTSSIPINYNMSNDINFLGVYNYTIIADDTSGNIINDTVFVFVLNVTDISIKSKHYIMCEYGETGNVLNWTVISLKGGTYTIYLINGTKKTQLTTGAFNPREPIVYPADGLPIGLHNFTIVVKSEGRPPIEDYFLVRVSANPDIESGQDMANITHQRYSEPVYKFIPPENPWPPIITGGFLVLASCIVGYWYITRRLMVPSAVKNEKKAIKKARKAKDIYEEGKRLGAIGRVYFKAGSYRKAIKSHKQALAIFEKIGDKKAQIRELESLGNAYLAQGVEERHD